MKSTPNIKLKTNNNNKSIFFKNKNTKRYFTLVHPTVQFIPNLGEVEVFLHFLDKSNEK